MERISKNTLRHVADYVRLSQKAFSENAPQPPRPDASLCSPLPLELCIWSAIRYDLQNEQDIRSQVFTDCMHVLLDVYQNISPKLLSKSRSELQEISDTVTLDSINAKVEHSESPAVLLQYLVDQLLQKHDTDEADQASVLLGYRSLGLFGDINANTLVEELLKYRQYVLRLPSYLLTDDIETLIAKRQTARNDKDYAYADYLLEVLGMHGISVNDNARSNVSGHWQFK